MALKLDMEKAFDSMEWEFLLKILPLLGFNSMGIYWIRQCITTSCFSILLDGAPFGKFFHSQGLRENDPLSSFLFILGYEILSRLILREDDLGSLHGIKMARWSPPISHLLFADDVLMLSWANAREAQSILNCLTSYFNWSGQCINVAKSAVFYSTNCRLVARSSINGILNLAQILTRAKYLRIPYFMHSGKDSLLSFKSDFL